MQAGTVQKVGLGSQPEGSLRSTIQHYVLVAPCLLVTGYLYHIMLTSSA